MLSDFLDQALSVASFAWWLVIPPILYVLFKDFWYVRVIHNYINKFEWEILEIKIPNANAKTLRSMEQVMASIYATFSFGIKKRDRFFKGEIEDWASLEMVGFSESVHFYVRIQKKYRKLVESAFFSQYPDIEITEVEDYTKLLPSNLPDNNYDIFATDFIFTKPDVYPIRTHLQFEFSALDEMKYVDPLATITEVMSHLQENELIWIQFIIRPVDDAWAKGAKDVVDELQGKAKPKKKSIFSMSGEFLGNLIGALVVHPEWSDGGDDKPAPTGPIMPGAQDTIKAVQNKISKNAFEVIPRFVYIDEKDAFTTENVQAVLGAFRQFSSAQNQNAFRPGTDTLTVKKYASKIPINSIRKKALEKRKKKMYQNYIHRAIPQGTHDPYGLKLKPIIMNIEELATVFHPPILSVRAPGLQPTESKRGEAPVDLPTRD